MSSPSPSPPSQYSNHPSASPSSNSGALSTPTEVDSPQKVSAAPTSSSSSPSPSPPSHSPSPSHHSTPRRPPLSFEYTHTTIQPSLLSTDAPPQNFRGLINLGAIILIVMNARLVVENFQKYGWLIRFYPTEIFMERWPRILPCIIMGFILVFGHPIVALLIEKYSLKYVHSDLSAKVAKYLHIINIFLMLIIPPIVTIHYNGTFLSGICLQFIEIIFLMKITSYAHVNSDIRREKRRLAQSKKTDKKDIIVYSSDLSTALLSYSPTLSHLYYFLLAPTLVYQISYPRSPSIRFPFILRRTFELIFCITLQLVLVEQYMLPTVSNSMVHFENLNYLSIIERILKLSIPLTIHWLLMFYSIFHCLLNLTAELLRFGDRIFYKEWWNCVELGQYWRYWNLPVHNWIVKHVYFPCLSIGMTSLQAQLIAFLLSAIGHEMLVSIPTHHLNSYAFIGMMMQVPLIAFSQFANKKFNAPWLGNCTFWISFLVFGQPIIVMQYCYGYLKDSI